VGVGGTGKHTGKGGGGNRVQQPWAARRRRGTRGVPPPRWASRLGPGRGLRTRRVFDTGIGRSLGAGPFRCERSAGRSVSVAPCQDDLHTAEQPVCLVGDCEASARRSPKRNSAEYWRDSERARMQCETALPSSSGRNSIMRADRKATSVRVVTCVRPVGTRGTLLA
jgi:hypothetical protein